MATSNISWPHPLARRTPFVEAPDSPYNMKHLSATYISKIDETCGICSCNIRETHMQYPDKTLATATLKHLLQQKD
jgi:hypothetical protein